MASYPLFDGTDIDAWAQHFKFSPGLVSFLKETIGVTTVIDLVYVYSDPELLKEIESSTKRLEFLKFKQTKDFVTHFNPELIKKRKEFEEWIEKNKLGGTLLDLFQQHQITNLTQLTTAFTTNAPNLELVYQQLKPIPQRKLKQCLQEFVSSASVSKESSSSVSKEMVTVTKSLQEIAINTMISLDVEDVSFEEYNKSLKLSPPPAPVTASLVVETWSCHICHQHNDAKLTQCRDCFTVKKGTPAPAIAASSAAIFKGFTCDECKTSPIKGVRYCCTIRKNFDLCENCEKLRVQPHPMLKLYSMADQPVSVETVYPDGNKYKQTVFIPEKGGSIAEKGAIPPPPPAEDVKLFRDFRPLSESRSEESDYMMKTVRVKELTVSIPYWTGFYGLSSEVMEAVRSSGLMTVEELGKKWHDDPKHLDRALANTKTNAKDRGKVIRGLNDAETLYLDSKK